MDHQRSNSSNNSSPTTGLLSRFINCIISYVLFFYYLIYCMFRGGREATYSDPAVCAIHKCPLQSAHKGTNICCIHGIQTKTTTENGAKKEEEKTKATNGRPAGEKNGSATAAMIEASKEEVGSKSHTQLLKDRFEKLTQAARTELYGVANQEAERSDSWFQKACKWFSFSKTASKEASKVDGQTKESGKVAHGLETTQQGPPPAPPPPPVQGLPAELKFKEVEPQYPLSLFADRAHMSELKEKLSSRALEFDAQPSKPNAAEWHFASPQPPRMETKAKFVAEIKKARKTSSANEEEEEEEEEVEMPKKKFSSPAIMQQPLTFYQVPQKARLIIRTTYEDDHSKNVQIIKKDWSEDGKNVGESAPINVYRPTGIVSQAPMNSRVDNLSDAVNAAASRKKQYNAQLLEQNYRPDYRTTRRGSSSDRLLLPYDSGPRFLQSNFRDDDTSNQFDVERSYKKYTRYTYQTSSYQSTGNEETENMDHLPKKLRNPMGEIHDYQNMSREYGDHLLTNIASPEKCHELSNMLSSDKEAEKSVELFHKRKQRAEQYVVDNENLGKTTLPPVAPPAKKPVTATDLYEATVKAASTKAAVAEQGMTTKRPVESSAFRQVDPNVYRNSDAYKVSMATGRQTPAFDHERLFSPVPFNKASGSRAYTPVPTDFISPIVGQSQSAAPSSQYQNRRPFTRQDAYYTDGSYGYNTLPKGWKSLSQANLNYH